MKRIALIFGVAVLGLMMATPASAITADQLDMEGSFRARYKVNLNPGMTDVTGAPGESTDALFDQRFRLQTRFRPTDFLDVTLRFDALERVWGTPGEVVSNSGLNTVFNGQPQPNLSDSNNVDFEYAYMTLTTSYGKFDIGRMSALAWGTSFVDNETDADRIKYTLPIDNLVLVAIMQKNVERDAFDIGGESSDQDSTTYYLAGIYRMENASAGLLIPYNRDGLLEQDRWALMPYIQGNYGQFRYQAEAAWWTGTWMETPAGSVDIDALAFNVEVGYSANPFFAELGYAYTSGQDSSNDVTAFPGGVGEDWEKLLILTSTSQNLENSLGNVGNLAGGISAVGSKILYAGMGMTPAIEGLSLELLWGWATADEVPVNMDDDLGHELDLICNYQVYDNLSFTGILGYLMAGDAWGTDPEDPISLYTSLELKF